METEFRTLTGKVVTVPEDHLKDVQSRLDMEDGSVAAVAGSSLKRKEVEATVVKKPESDTAPQPQLLSDESLAKRPKLATEEQGKKKSVSTWDSVDDEEFGMIANLTEASLLAGAGHDGDGDISMMTEEDDALFLQIPDDVAKGQ